nr:type II toxin-antitoxin system Phd/YefM family antitoxin [Acidobacteriota bacterium]
MPRRASTSGGGRVAAAEFKARCLELMDHVRETGAEYVVTKHGTPVARLV